MRIASTAWTIVEPEHIPHLTALSRRPDDGQLGRTMALQDVGAHQAGCVVAVVAPAERSERDRSIRPDVPSSCGGTRRPTIAARDA